MPLLAERHDPITPVSTDVLVVGAPTGFANASRLFAVSVATASSEVGVGKSYWLTLGAIATGLVPAGYGADCSAPAPEVSLTALSQYQRVPSGETDQLLTSSRR